MKKIFLPFMAVPHRRSMVKPILPYLASCLLKNTTQNSHQEFVNPHILRILFAKRLKLVLWRIRKEQ